MIREKITLDEVIVFLNELVALDEGFLRRLIETRTWCSKALADHPTVQIAGYEDRSVAGHTVKVPVAGFLGVLNGLFGQDDAGWGAISAIFRDGKLVRFQRTSMREGEVLDGLGKLSRLSAEDIEKRYVEDQYKAGAPGIGAQIERIKVVCKHSGKQLDAWAFANGGVRWSCPCGHFIERADAELPSLPDEIFVDDDCRWRAWREWP